MLEEYIKLLSESASYLLLPAIYLVNIKILENLARFPITICFYLITAAVLGASALKIDSKGLARGSRRLTTSFGQSLDASKPSTMLFRLCIDHYWHGVDIRFKTIRPNHRKILRFFMVVGLVLMAAVEMAQIILTGSSSNAESISVSDFVTAMYNFIKFGKRTTTLFRTGIFARVNLNLAQHPWLVSKHSTIYIAG